MLLTLVTWHFAKLLYNKVENRFLKPFVNPVFTSVLLIISFLYVGGHTFEEYNRGASLISFFLFPSVVAMAVLIVRYFALIRKNIVSLVIILVIGSITGIVSASAIVIGLGSNEIIAKSMAAKSVTTPIAIGITEMVGGIPSLTAAVVIVTGILGAMVGPELLMSIGIRNRAAVGFAMGLSSHGIGTARVIDDELKSENKITSSMSSLGMVLNGLITAFILPYLLPLILKIGFK